MGVWRQTSGAGMLAGAGEVMVLDTVLELERLMDRLGFSSWAAFPFTCIDIKHIDSGEKSALKYI